MISDYIAVDVETTGLNPERDKLLEIGAVKIFQGKPTETCNILINTEIPVPARIQELTGITDEMRKTGEKAGEAIREFIRFRGELPIVGHNVIFDFGFLKQAAVNEGCSFEAEALDTLKIARRVLPGLPSKTLGAMCTYYGIDPGNAHRALDDACSAHELLKKMWEEFGQADPGAFLLQKLVHKAKKQSPITKAQKGYLNDLVKYHKIEMNIRIEDMTKSEASRMIDHMISQYGKIRW